MTFEDYKNTIWQKEHPFSSIFNGIDDAEESLDMYCLQKIDWIEYCIKNKQLNEINNLIISETIDILIDYFKNCAINLQKNKDCFASPGNMLLHLFEICNNPLKITKDFREEKDDMLLHSMKDVFNKLYLEKIVPFDNLMEKVLSWYDFRKNYCHNIQIGFSPLEYYIPSNFYNTYRDDFLCLRNRDFASILKFAEYSLWIYYNAKKVQREEMVGDLQKFNQFAILCCRNALVAAQNNGYFERIDPIKNTIRSLQSDLLSKPTIFISYNWGKETLVDEIEKQIGHLVNIKRDKYELRIGDSIIEFMNTIRTEDFALIVISDAYLKSEACMYELTTLFKDKDKDNFRKKVVFLICDDARSIYNSNERSKYTEFWDNKYKKLVKSKNKLTSETSVEITQRIRDVSYIRLQISEFLEYVSDAYNFEEKDAIQTISSFVKEMYFNNKIGRNILEDFFIAIKQYKKHQK